ncbi:hypothetical protein EDB81DRAFT_653716, partial [Dactylonectria macrodidyma]
LRICSEHKIDQIEGRLSNIETLLRDISQHPASTPGSIQLPNAARLLAGGNLVSGASSTISASPVDEGEDSENDWAFGCDSIILDQAAGASQILENAIGSITLGDANPEMHDALSNLRQLVELQSRQSISCGPRFPLQQRMPVGGPGQLPLPPVNVVVATLKRVKGTFESSSPPGLFTLICSFIGIHDFAKLCQMVYFPADDLPDTIYIIVNAGLYYLFLEQHILAPAKLAKEEVKSLIDQCRTNLETSLANLSLFMSPKIETIQALLLGTFYAIDAFRPTVAWHLNCAAVQVCQRAGFHRYEQLATPESSASRLKSTLFWHVYTIDKTLGLRLSRTPITQDWDINIPRTFHFEGTMSLEMSGVAMMWLKLATLQGDVYQKLYSPAALALPQSQLAERAGDLAAECRQLELEAAHHRAVMTSLLEGARASPLIDIYVKGDEVQLLSTMTLIYQATPPPPGSRFCNECIDAARRAMQQHLACMAIISRDATARSIYIHWNLALTHFAPFFVIFIYVIETLSTEDLQLLQEFGASLETTAELSETVQKLGRLWEVLSRVARLYVDVKTQQQESQFKILGDKFDAYLNQLGLISMEPEAVAGIVGTDMMACENAQAAQFANLISGSQNLMGLLEQDILDFSVL